MSDSRISVNGSAPPPKKDSLREQHSIVDQELVDRYERLKVKIAAAEQHFRSLRLPGEIEVRFGESDGEPGCSNWHSFGFARHKEEWCLVYSYCKEHDGYDGYESSFRPLAECSVDIKLMCCSRLGELKKEAAKSKVKYIKELDEVLNEIDEVIGE